VGVALGLAVGYRRGRVDGVVMRALDTFDVLPSLLPIVLVVGLLGRSSTVVVLVIAATFVPIVARSVRGATLAEREAGYVAAARLRGERGWYVATREVLPNVGGPIAVEGTVRLADAVFSIATLSFLGLGAEVGSPDWGAQVADNRTSLQVAWWTVLFPSLAIASLVVAVSLLADEVGAELDR
jgi:peptide/nickel transport system permease protein